MEIGYFPGCTLHASSQLYDIQSKLVLGELGINLHEIEDWNCCGATSASKTDDFLAIALPARNLGLAEDLGLPELFIPCSSCYSRMRVAQNRLAADKELKEEINAELSKKVKGDISIMSILQILLLKVESGELPQMVKRPLEGLRPVCYYGCLQTRFPCEISVPDNVENPQGMEMVCRALGANPLDWGYKTDCCGASASVNDLDTALMLMSRILKDATERGANCMVTTCPMCQLNLDAYQEQVNNKYGIDQLLPVYFITELIGIAMGKSPKELQIDRHFVDAVGPLKEWNLL
jgi:heterodisulfide reductase subunit B